MKRWHAYLVAILLAAGLLAGRAALYDRLLEASLMLQATFSTWYQSLQTIWLRHLHQAEHIARLQENEKLLQKRLLQMVQANAKMSALIGSPPPLGVTKGKFWRVQVLGYQELGNFQRLWIQPFVGFDPSQNYGVVYRGHAIGIVVGERGRPLMLLSGDRGCRFAVFVGKERAPGIAVGEDGRHMEVRYIPEWITVQPGDKVRTSGLDRIFTPNIPVGYVVSVQRMQGFQNARIVLMGDTLHPAFVWLIRP